MLVAEVLADGARFTLLVLPFSFQLEADAPPPDPQARLRAWASQRRVGFVDALPMLRRAKAPPFLDEDHLTRDGARHLAEELIRSGALTS